jgi:hypothetical protein
LALLLVFVLFHSAQLSTPAAAAAADHSVAAAAVSRLRRRTAAADLADDLDGVQAELVVTHPRMAAASGTPSDSTAAAGKSRLHGRLRMAGPDWSGGAVGSHLAHVSHTAFESDSALDAADSANGSVEADENERASTASHRRSEDDDADAEAAERGTAAAALGALLEPTEASGASAVVRPPTVTRAAASAAPVTAPADSRLDAELKKRDRKERRAHSLSACRDPIEARFVEYRSKMSDIYEHLDTLYEMSRDCRSVLELGVRNAVSSWAFALGLIDQVADNYPDRLPPLRGRARYSAYDLTRSEGVASFERHLRSTACRQWIEYTFTEVDDLEVAESRIPSVDLVFIDTVHDYLQLKRELARFAPKSSRYVVLHDTLTFGLVDESERNGWQMGEWIRDGGRGRRGLQAAIDEFLLGGGGARGDEWRLRERFTNNNGLTLLQRRRFAN